MKSTTKTPTLTRAEISAKLDQIRAIKISLASNLDVRDRAVAAVAAKYAGGIETLATSIADLEDEVRAWAFANRESEFGQEKTLEFKSGATVAFRTGAKQIVFAAGKDEDKVLAALQKRKLSAFIRAKYSLNRSALLSAIGTKLLPASLAKTIGILTEQKETVTITIPMATAGKEAA